MIINLIFWSKNLTMNKKTLKTLEFDKILEEIANFTFSKLGEEKVFTLAPSIKKDEILKWQKETSSAVSMILKKGSLKLSGTKDITSYLKRVDVNGVLNSLELLQISRFLYNCQKAKDYSKQETKGESNIYTVLDNYFDTLEPISDLEREINRCIISEDEISDDATPQLKEIRRSIKNTNNNIKEQLNHIIHSSSYKNMLQEPVITMREGRYCVPVKAEYKASFSGIVHDQSATGATAFIEPASVVQLNNKLKSLNYDEKQEIFKILANLSNSVYENKDALEQNLSILASLDFIFAKGEYSISINATEPIFNENGYINIKKGRHPLLDQTKVVPTDIYLGKDFHTLLITGPNTGGKTVALKTIGLFTVMGQSGLHIPAFDNSELAIFENVYSDIGDEQSIEQNLSTFSSHMTNIIKILNEITDNSLILLDELGAGTDPTEGACLAMSIIKYLHERKIRTVVTTHYSELKVFAITTDRIENASCEFDIQTLKPTYRLLIGIPGKSNAFAISKRLGLSDFIIDDAKMMISKEDANLEDVITELEISKKTLLSEQEKAESYRLEAAKLKSELEKQKKKTKEQKQRILEKATEDAKRIVAQAKFESDNVIKEVNKLAKEKAAQSDLNQQRQRLKDRLSKYDEKLTQFKNQKQKLKKVPKNLKKGDNVFINSLNQNGIVTSLPNSKGEVMVKAGIMSIKVNLKDLSLSAESQKQEIKDIKPKKVASSLRNKKSLNISSEIDLRGYYVDEALEKLIKYIDDAYLSSISIINIIHGKGTGALRTAIHDYLKRAPYIKDYRLGEFGEGDSGVTIAKLK